MISPDVIKRALGAHGMWKQRLKQAISTGSSEFKVENVRPDNLCDFGKWLISLTPAEQQSSHYKSIKELHAKFHIEAAHVLGLAVKGQKQAATEALGHDSNYAKISTSLTLAMMDWESSITGIAKSA
jgi:hypothetical protein